MFGGIPAFGGHSLGGSIERSATLTAKDSRLDIESETFFVHGVDVRNGSLTGELTHTLQAGYHAPDPGGTPHILSDSRIRRSTPRECERLQGMADDYTMIPWRGKPASKCPDGPRYKAIGNSRPSQWLAGSAGGFCNNFELPHSTAWT